MPRERPSPPFRLQSQSVDQTARSSPYTWATAPVTITTTLDIEDGGVVTPYGEKLEEIQLTDYVDRGEKLVDVSDIPEVVEITSCRHVASYPWLRGKDPTILVPGASIFPLFF